MINFFTVISYKFLIELIIFFTPLYLINSKKSAKSSIKNRSSSHDLDRTSRISSRKINSLYFLAGRYQRGFMSSRRDDLEEFDDVLIRPLSRKRNRTRREGRFAEAKRLPPQGFLLGQKRWTVRMAEDFRATEREKWSIPRNLFPIALVPTVHRANRVLRSRTRDTTAVDR